MRDIYVSIDIETTGPAPGLYSMISLGAAAFTRDGDELDTWSQNLAELSAIEAERSAAASRHPDTMAWWATQPEAWALATRAQQRPGNAMASFVAWVERLDGKPVAAAWPAAYDFAFINWYCHRFTGGNPLGYACLDIRSLAQGLTYSRGYYDLRENQIKAMREEVDTGGLTEHVAVDDAIKQGRLLVALLKRTRGGVPNELRAAREASS